MSETRNGVLVGIAEIASLAGRPKQTVLHWTRRSDFPDPVDKLRMGTAWSREEVQVWMEDQAQAGGLLAPPE